MKDVVRQMLVSRDSDETRVAVVEDGRLVELKVERPRRSTVGNVYLGVVTDVLPGMQAAFVDIGLEKNAYLSADEVVDERGRRAADIMGSVRVGQPLMVQVTRDAMGTKGARVTTDITLPGRFLVLLPFARTIGISRKVSDAERDRLQEIIEPLMEGAEFGLIVRTVAEDASRRDIETDLGFLKRLWNRIQRVGAEALPPEIVYSEMDLTLRMVRDVFSEDFKRLVIDDKATYDKVTSFLKKSSPDLLKRVYLHKGPESILSAHGVQGAVFGSLSRSVALSNGAYIVIDHTEAMTVVDVNTGRYVGKRSLEDTALATNLLAAEEVARQLRLRDIGGIIVVDFIDMASAEHREQVWNRMSESLANDRVKTRLGEFTKLGLLEMTRKQQVESVFDSLTEQCPVCHGTGYVLSEDTVRIEVERRVIRAVGESRQGAFLVGVHPETHALITQPGRNFEATVKARTGKEVRVVPDTAITAKTDVRVLITGRPGD